MRLLHDKTLITFNTATKYNFHQSIHLLKRYRRLIVDLATSVEGVISFHHNSSQQWVGSADNSGVYPATADNSAIYPTTAAEWSADDPFVEKLGGNNLIRVINWFKSNSMKARNANVFCKSDKLGYNSIWKETLFGFFQVWSCVSVLKWKRLMLVNGNSFMIILTILKPFLSNIYMDARLLFRFCWFQNEWLMRIRYSYHVLYRYIFCWWSSLAFACDIHRYKKLNSTSSPKLRTKFAFKSNNAGGTLHLQWGMINSISVLTEYKYST